MGWIDSLQRAINYTEDHLLDDLSIEDIAMQANCSVFHFQRVFTLLTEVSIGEYIRRRRLTLAAQELSRTDSKIIDLAFKFGYETPEAFSKAFRKQHGMSPREARKYTGKLTSYNRLVIQVSLKGADPMQYKIVEQKAFQVVGIKREYSLENEENLIGIPKMWEQVHRDGTNNRLVQLNNGKVPGVLGVCVDKNNNQMDYWIATAYEGETPDGFEKLEIPAAKWAIFEVHGAMPEAMRKAWKKIFSEWFPSSGYKPAGTPELEVYPDEDASSPDYVSEIWIPVK